MEATASKSHTAMMTEEKKSSLSFCLQNDHPTRETFMERNTPGLYGPTEEAAFPPATLDLSRL